MSGVGAFIVGAAIGGAAVAHHKNKQKHKQQHHHYVHNDGRTVVVHHQPTPNPTQVVYVTPAYPPPAPKPKSVKQKYPSQRPLPPNQHTVVTTYYQNAPAHPTPGYGAPIGFMGSQTANMPSPCYYAGQPPPYSPQSVSHAPPFTHPNAQAPVPASYPPQSPVYQQAQPFQSHGYPPAAPFQSPGYPSNPYPSSYPSGGYPPAPLPTGYPPPVDFQQAGTSYPPAPVANSFQPNQQMLQAQVSVQLSSYGAGSTNSGTNSTAATNSYRRYFVIVNSETHYALQVNAVSGSKLVMQPKQPVGSNDALRTSQMWYLDDGGVLRSRCLDYAIESKDGGRWLCVAPYNGDPRQQWILRDGRILANRMNPGDCICLEDGLMGTAVNADVIASSYQGKPHHHWHIEYM